MDRRLLALACAGLLSACATPPAALSGAPFSSLSVAAAQREGHEGQGVRWGGDIVSTSPGQTDTCFEVVSRPLDRAARPRQTDETDGRFIACAPGFYDPAVYAAGRELTVIGTVQAATTGKIGAREYRFPRVTAEKVYLWPRRQPPVAYYDPWFYDPWFYNPWVVGPYWYPFWGPMRYCPGPYCW